MKPISVLAAVLSVAALSTAVACKKNEPVTSETNTTGATVQPEQPATEPVTPPPVQPQVTTGSATDTTTSNQSGMRQSGAINKGKDAGIATDFPTGGSDLIDRDQQYNKSNPNKGINPGSTTQGSTTQGSSTQGSSNAKQQDRNNHSTPLGDSESGQYTGGKGTYGGKATWGTGPKKDTQMDQPKK